MVQGNLSICPYLPEKYFVLIVLMTYIGRGLIGPYRWHVCRASWQPTAIPCTDIYQHIARIPPHYSMASPSPSYPSPHPTLPIFPLPLFFPQANFPLHFISSTICILPPFTPINTLLSPPYQHHLSPLSTSSFSPLSTTSFTPFNSLLHPLLTPSFASVKALFHLYQHPPSPLSTRVGHPFFSKERKDLCVLFRSL